MRLPPTVVAELAQLLHQPDPPDLVSPTGARRAHLLTHTGDPARLDTLLGQLLASLRLRRGERLGPIDEARP